MKILYLLLVGFMVCGCVRREDSDSIKLIEVEQAIQTKMIQAQNKILKDLTKAIGELEKEIKSIKKWK